MFSVPLETLGIKDTRSLRDEGAAIGGRFAAQTTVLS